MISELKVTFPALVYNNRMNYLALLANSVNGDNQNKENTSTREQVGYYSYFTLAHLIPFRCKNQLSKVQWMVRFTE